MSYPLVIIQWNDAASPTLCKWAPVADMVGKELDYPCVTVGYLVEKTKEHVVVAGTLVLDSDPPEFGHSYFQIPLGCITKTEYIKPKRRTKKAA